MAQRQPRPAPGYRSFEWLAGRGWIFLLTTAVGINLSFPVMKAKAQNDQGQSPANPTFLGFPPIQEPETPPPPAPQPTTDIPPPGGIIPPSELGGPFPAPAMPDPATGPGRLIEIQPIPGAGQPEGAQPEPLPPAMPTSPEEGVADEADANESLIEAVQLPETEIELIINRAKLFEARRPLSKIVIDNPDVVDFQPLADPEDGEFQLFNLYGISYGTANLTLIGEDNRPQSFRVRVLIDAEDIQRRINTSFPGADVRVSQVAADVILDGQVPDAKTMSDVLDLVISEMGINGLLGAGNRGQGQGAGGGMAGGMGGPGGGMGGAGGGMGGGMGGAGGGMGGGMGGMLAGMPIINRVHVPGPRQVLLKVKIAELNRSSLRQLGVNFQRITAGDIITSTVGGVSGLAPELIGIFDEGNFSLFIKALRQNGLAKILAEPNLVTLDGQPAQFFSGDEIPYQTFQAGIATEGTFDIQFRQTGSVLQFLPIILDDDRVRLDIESSFSIPEFSLLINGQPTINRRGARTVVELREGQTLAIAGLLQYSQRGTTTRIPLLGDIPIVGPWFSSNSITVEETELILLVTPMLVEPMDGHKIPPSPGDLVMEPNDYEFYFLGRLENRTGKPHRSAIHYLDPLEIMKHFESEKHWVIGPHGYADD